jgi:hypothetical protein
MQVHLLDLAPCQKFIAAQEVPQFVENGKSTAAVVV